MKGKPGPYYRRTASELTHEAWERIQAAYAHGDGFGSAYASLYALFVEAGAPHGGPHLPAGLCGCESCFVASAEAREIAVKRSS